jgi:hypothetical protein
MTRSPLTVAGVAVAGVVLSAFVAACGGSSNSTANDGGSLNQRSAVALRELASCIRAHGLPNFPDPQIGSDGVPRFPDSAPGVPGPTQRACRTVANRIPPDYAATTAVSTTDYGKLLRLARCIRAHGVHDWPDPNSLGEFPIDRRLQHDGKRVAAAALRACARLNPDPNGGIHVVNAQQ